MMKKKAGEPEQPLMKCMRCNGRLSERAEEAQGMRVRVWKCGKCGFSIAHPEDMRKLLMREKGVQASVGKVGRQTVIRIPASIRDMYALHKKKFVKIIPKSDAEVLIEV